MADVKATANTTAVTKEAKDLEAFKAKKAEAAKRFKERKAAEKIARVEGAKAALEEIKKSNIKLSEKTIKFLEGLANPVSATGSSQISFFNKVYGPTPKVGDVVTLKQVFEKTAQGKSRIDSYVSKWAKEGTIVEYKEDASSLFNSTYTIKAIKA